jgi:hypothetical protein
MRSKQPPQFKASQLYDWHSEPKEDRGSSFFFEESTYAMPSVRKPPPRKRTSTLGTAVIVAVMFGVVGLIAMSHLL